jgi:cytosine/adenosine deaminase-related metal-dependent hydrolase
MRTPNHILIGPDATSRTVYCTEGRICGAEEAKNVDDAHIERLQCPEGGVIVPGAINAHTHLYSAFAALGMPAPQPPPENFVQILQRVWWKLDRVLDRETLLASARLYVAEALLAGTTTLIDHHESPNFIEGSLDVLAQACDEFGIRACLCYGATERNFGRDEAREGLQECKRFIQSNTRKTIRAAVGLHASFTVSDETIQEAADLAQELASPMHIHVAEDGADVEDAKRRGYEGVIDRLEKNGALQKNALLAHGIHLTPAEVQTALNLGAWFVQNPRSNKGNKVGYPMSLAGVERVAVGTDGYPAAMNDEYMALKQEASVHKDVTTDLARRCRQATVMAENIFGASFNSVAVDAVADVCVLVDTKVHHVVVDGRVVIKNGELVDIDLAQIRSKAMMLAPGLFERMEKLS